MPAPENFRLNLKAVLEYEGLSQYQLSDMTAGKGENAVPITRSYLNKILLGAVEPSMTVCERIAAAVKCPLPIMILDPKVFKRLLEEGVDKSAARDGSLLGRELLTAATAATAATGEKPKPPGLHRRSPVKTQETPEKTRLRLWVRRRLQAAIAG